jgi:hypothetical protein
MEGRPCCLMIMFVSGVGAGVQGVGRVVWTSTAAWSATICGSGMAGEFGSAMIAK